VNPACKNRYEPHLIVWSAVIAVYGLVTECSDDR